MPQSYKIPPQNQTWEHRYVAIYRCSAKKASGIKVANRAEIKHNSDLQRVLRVLQLGMISKRDYPSAANPTIRYATFRRNGKVDGARQWLNKLLSAEKQRDVEKWALKLAEKYALTSNVARGVLIFLISVLKLNGNPENCVFVFKCDFEDISQLTTEQIFERIEDAFEEEAKKGAQYPYFNGRKFERNIVRVFDSLGQTQYWQTFLDLIPRPSEETLQAVIIRELTKTHPELIEKYHEEIQSLNEERSLAADEHPIEREDRLLPHEVERVNAALPANLSDSKTPLALDKARVWAPIREYGRTWTLAEQFGTFYVLLKGSQLEVRGSLTLLDLPGLQEAVDKLGVPIGGQSSIPLSLDAEKNPILKVYQLFRESGIEPLDNPGFVGFKNLKLSNLKGPRAQEFIRFLRRTPSGALSLCRLTMGKERLIDFTASSVIDWLDWDIIEKRLRLCANCRGVFSEFRADLDAYQQGAPWPREDIESDGLALLADLAGCKSCGARFRLEITLDKDIVVKEYLLGEPVNLKESINALLWRNPESMEKAFNSFESFLRFISRRADKPLVIFFYEAVECYQGDFFKILSLTDSAESISKQETKLAEQLAAFTTQTLADYQSLCKNHKSENRPGENLPPSLFLQQGKTLAQYPAHQLFSSGPLRSVLVYALTAWLIDTVSLDGETVRYSLPSRGQTGPEFTLVFSMKDVRSDGVTIFQKKTDWPKIVGLVVREIGQSAGNKELRRHWTDTIKSRSVNDFASPAFFSTLEAVCGEFVERKERPKELAPKLIHLLVFLNAQNREIKFQLNGDRYIYEDAGKTPLGAGHPGLVASEMSELARLSLSRVLELDRSTQVELPTLHRLQMEGVSLWENSVPPELKKAYIEWCDLPDLPTLYIISEDPSFPWELVRPLEEAGGGRSEKDIDGPWWAMSFSLARWLSNVPPPAERLKLKRICCVATKAQLPAAEKEIADLEKLGKCDFPQTFDELIADLGERDYDVVHFACHGRFDTKQPNESVILLPDGSLLRPTDFGILKIKKKFKKNRPLVFLNSCDSGRTGSTLIGLEGWAKCLIGLKCGAFIGCGWEVDDMLAAEFAAAFYKFFRRGETLGKAVLRARLQIQQKAPGNSTWLAYYLYGNPNGVI